MKKLLSAAFLACCALTAWSATIDPNNKFAYGANIAWVNWEGYMATGAFVTVDICGGSIWSANCGWVHLGDGSPDSGPHYGNNSAGDYGVNLDAAGNLSGFAYGANIGWLQFHPLGQPKIDLLSGNFSGDVWSANCGWINLSNAFAHVRTESILPAMDADNDGLPDSWELRFARALDVLGPIDDPDQDGISNRDEAIADTNPFDAGDALRITMFAIHDGQCTINWPSRPNRLYRLLKKPDLSPTSSWQDAGQDLIMPGPSGETTARFTESAGAQGFFRIEPIKPLSP
jgi:hypothetical protein